MTVSAIAGHVAAPVLAQQSLPAPQEQDPASRLKGFRTAARFPHPERYSLGLKKQGSVSSGLMKYSLSLSFRYHDLYQAKQNPDKSFKSKHELNGLRHGLRFPYSAALWKAEKFCIMQILARTFDTTCSEFFCLLFPLPLLYREDSNSRASRSPSVRAGQRDVFRQRNL